MIVPLRIDRTQSIFHVTVLSNFARGYDKYRRQYCKGRIPESTYPDEFYVLDRAELGVGIRKASALLEKLALAGDQLIALEARLAPETLKQSVRVGLVWPSPNLPVHEVHRIVSDGLVPTRIEETMASSLALNANTFLPYADLRPRSLSFLPIARGCQAACPFCFSEGSASAGQKHAALDWEMTERWLGLARARGARRAVITGGGEPTLLGWRSTTALVGACAASFDTVVLITNGFSLANDKEPSARLRELREAGLSVLAVSRHHPQEAANARLMNLETRTPTALAAYRSVRAEVLGLRVRLVCVLQRGGVESASDVEEYVAWAAAAGADEVCFKELYVSTSLESLYHSSRSNEFSARHQVSVAIVHDWASRQRCQIVETLPWGAPVFETFVGGRLVRVAAYTEPSLFWERTAGIARSWNVMADGMCLVSLEDRGSVIALGDAVSVP